MPQKKTSQPTPYTCKHETLRLDPSPYAAITGYKRPPTQQRTAATTVSGHVKATQNIKVPDPAIFPAPLVLPDDDLAFDPTYPAQSFRSWLREKDRNKVTADRRTIYIARPPDIDPEVEFLKSWGSPRIAVGKGKDRNEAGVAPPDMNAVVRYLKAFYHGFAVKLLPPSGLKFAAWDDDDASPKPARKRGRSGPAAAAALAKAKSTPKSSLSKVQIPTHIALNTSKEAIRIRTRSRTGTSPFPAQLNLNDVLDAVIAILPDDAYALLLLVEQDLYEDDDDEFVCGRAYGGSRVAVVSTARYHPALDTLRVEREHAWPGSHCQDYIARCCAASEAPAEIEIQDSLANPGNQQPMLLDSDSLSPLRAALIAHSSLPSFSSPATLAGLWLSRVCKTASHELGHCFGIDHCVYYACVMQGSAGMAEDARQPPYACPVDKAKLAGAAAEATGQEVDGKGKDVKRQKWIRTWESERRLKLRIVCGEMGEDTHLWRAYGAWLGGLEEEER